MCLFLLSFFLLHCVPPPPIVIFLSCGPSPPPPVNFLRTPKLQVNGTMQSPVRKLRLHRALGQESIVSGNATFFGSIDAFSVWRVGRPLSDIIASMEDTSDRWRWSPVTNATIFQADTRLSFEPLASSNHLPAQRTFVVFSGTQNTIVDSSLNYEDATASCTAGCVVPSTRPTYACGDGFAQGWEDCDDGNTVSGDGCTSTCRAEPGFVCEGGVTFATVCFPGSLYTQETFEDVTLLNKVWTTTLSAAGSVVLDGAARRGGAMGARIVTNEVAAGTNPMTHLSRTLGPVRDGALLRVQVRMTAPSMGSTIPLFFMFVDLASSLAPANCVATDCAGQPVYTVRKGGGVRGLGVEGLGKEG